MNTHNSTCLRPALTHLIAILNETGAEPVGAEQWPEIIAEAERHSVTVLLADHVLRRPRWSPPSEWRQVLEEARRASLLRSVALRGLLIEIGRALADAGIEPVLLKGLSAERFYRRPGLRHIGDIDLLVQPSEAKSAVEILLAIGFTIPAYDPWHRRRSWQQHLRAKKEIELHRAGEVLELHWRHVTTCRLLPRDFAAELDGFRMFELSPYNSIASLAPRAGYVYMSVHGAMHQWTRLNWLMDISPALKQLSEEDIGAIMRYGQRLGLLETLLLGPAVGQVLAGWSLPQPFAAAITNNSRLQRMVAYCVDLASSETVIWETPEHDRFRQFRFGLRLRRSLGYQMDYTRRGVARLIAGKFNR